MSRFLILLAPFAIGVAFASTSLGAQSVRSLEPGAQVRITSPAVGDGKHRARVLAVKSEEIVFQLDGRTDSTTLRRGQLISLERADGTRSRGRRGMAVGFLAGAAVGVIAGASATGANCEPDSIFVCEDPNNAALAVAGGIGVGALGMLVGGVVGLFMRTERWVPVERAQWLSNASLSEPNGRGAVVRIAF